MTQDDTSRPTPDSWRVLDHAHQWTPTGVSVLAPSLGIGRFHLNLSPTPRVTVLYGLNGSGKTRTLRHIAAAFGGPAPEVPTTLHIRLRQPEYCPPETWVTNALWAGLIEHSRDAAEQLGSEPITIQMLNDRDEYEWNYTHWITTFLARAHGIDFNIARAIGESGLLTLTVDEAGVDSLAIAVALDSSTPLPSPKGQTLASEALSAETLDPRVWPNTVIGRYRDPLTRLRDAAIYRSLEPAPPDWVSFPILTIARAPRVAPPTRILVNVDPASLGRTLLEALPPELRVSGIFAPNPNGGTMLQPDVAATLWQLNALASEVALLVIPSCPRVAVDVRDPESLLSPSGPILLEAVRAEDSSRLAFEALSEAERYWYEVGLRLALAQRAQYVEAGAIVLDEPDRGLHPAARRALAATLTDIATSAGLPVIVCSHSSELIGADGPDLWHVSRSSTGDSSVHRLERPMIARIDDIARLGLERADILQFLRLLVVVEGEHDKAVLEAIFERELAAIGGHVLAMRGTEELSSILDCQFLTQFTDANVLVVVDNTRRTLVDAWRRSQSAYRRGPIREAHRILSKAVPTVRATSEEKKLATFLLDGLSRAGIDRVHVMGLAEPDILRYLPVDQFFESARSWDDLAQMAANDGQPSLKRWLKRSGKPVTAQSCREAAHLVRSLTPEFIELRQLLYDVAK